MGELQQMYDEVPPPSPVVLAEGRSRLTTLARDGGRRRSRRPALPGLLAAGLAGAVAAGVAVAVAVQSPDGGSGRMQTVSAHEVLTKAAADARSRPELSPRPGQYLHVRSAVAWGPGKVGKGRPAGKETRDSWVSVDGSKPGLLRAPCRTRPAKICSTPIPIEDESAAVPRPGSYQWMVRELPGLMRDWRTQTGPFTPGTAHTPGAVATPPTTGTPFGEWSWYGMGEILEGYLPPGLRAQVFEFLSDVPAVKVDEQATDALGHPAVALSLKSEGARLALLFDRSTYRYLGSHYVDLAPRPQGMDPTGEPDSATGEEKVTVLRVTVEDRLPARS
ncbi:CU044_5270 family protein [Actinomadura chokoriensis]|uniref:CU044_5270 family protein n=1 Tax=Actinomadura chokoriensis TaxID=454156 RepID=UPI0031F9D107